MNPSDRLKSEVNRTVSKAEGVRSVLDVVDQLRSHCAVFGAGWKEEVFGSGLHAVIHLDLDLRQIGEDAFNGAPTVTLEATHATITALENGSVPPAPFSSDPDGQTAPEIVTDPAPTVEPACAKVTEAVTDAAPEPEPALAEVSGPPPLVEDRTGLTWESWEDQRIITGRARGVPMKDIAKSLGRSMPSCWNRQSTLRSATGTVAPAAAAPAEIAASVVHVQAEAPTVAPPPSSMTDAEVRIDKRLDKLGRTALWGPGDDLELVEMLSLGQKLPAVALHLGIDLAVCKARFQQLVPDLAEQAAVLRVLKSRHAALKPKR